MPGLRAVRPPAERALARLAAGKFAAMYRCTTNLPADEVLVELLERSAALVESASGGGGRRIRAQHVDEARRQIEADLLPSFRPRECPSAEASAEAECPVCYERLAGEDADACGCPDCGRAIHRACAARWAARAAPTGPTCVTCRSPAWALWKYAASRGA